MKKWDKSNEEFVKEKGWELVEGYRITDEDMMLDVGDIFYFSKEDFSDFVHECKFWRHNEIESVYEDVDVLIEFEYEEYFDDNDDLYDEPV